MARILYISPGYTHHDYRFLSHIAESGHQVWLLPFKTPNPMDDMQSLPAQVTKLPPLLNPSSPWNPFQWLRALRGLKKHIRNLAPDIIHAGPVQTSAFLAALAGFHPLLVMSWGSDVLSVGVRNVYLRWVTRFTLGRTDMVFADCQAVQNKISAMVPLRPDQFVQFPWGVDTLIFHSRPSQLGLRKKLGWEKNFVLIYTRGFEPIHAPLVFLKALQDVVKQRPDVRVIMLGQGSLRLEAECYIAAHQLKKYIHLPGQVPNASLPDYFNEADLYISTTLSDGSSISLLEAMACGLSAIVANGEGNREWIVPGENGWLYPPGDAPQLAATILKALDPSTLRLTMGEANIKVIQIRADWTMNFKKLLTAYDRLLGKKSQPSISQTPVNA